MGFVLGLIIATFVWGMIFLAVAGYTRDLEAENKRLCRDYKQLASDDGRLLDLLMKRAREEIDRELET